jgi:hypothetical protein
MLCKFRIHEQFKGWCNCRARKEMGQRSLREAQEIIVVWRNKQTKAVRLLKAWPGDAGWEEARSASSMLHDGGCTCHRARSELQWHGTVSGKRRARHDGCALPGWAECVGSPLGSTFYTMQVYVSVSNSQLSCWTQQTKQGALSKGKYRHRLI